MSTKPTCIIAYTGEGERYAPMFEQAMEAAEASSARLIFYNADAASRFGGEPLPTFWSGEGDGDQFGSRLTPEMLEKAGRQELQGWVLNARARNIDAWGWLPSSRGADALAEYANEQGADLLFVPSDIEHTGLGGWLKGQPSAEQIGEAADQPVVIVELEPMAAATS